MGFFLSSLRNTCDLIKYQRHNSDKDYFSPSTKPAVCLERIPWARGTYCQGRSAPICLIREEGGGEYEGRGRRDHLGDLMNIPTTQYQSHAQPVSSNRLILVQLSRVADQSRLHLVN